MAMLLSVVVVSERYVRKIAGGKFFSNNRLFLFPSYGIVFLVKVDAPLVECTLVYVLMPLPILPTPLTAALLLVLA